MPLHRFGDLWVNYATPGSQSPTLDAATLTLAGQAPTLVPGTATLTMPTAAFTLAAQAPRVIIPGWPMDWVQLEPGSVSDITTTATTPVDVDTTNLVLAFKGPASGLVVVVANCLWLGSTNLSVGRCCLRDSGGLIAGTLTDMISGNNRYRWDVRWLMEVTPGADYVWTLGIAGDGSHAAGVRIGPDAHALIYVVDADWDIEDNRLTYLERPVQDGLPGSGGSIQNVATTTYQRSQLESLNYVDFPSFPWPSTGIIMFSFSGTFVTATPASADAYIGVWDRDAGAFLAGSGMIEGGGAGSARHHPILRKILSGLPTSGTANLGIAHKVSSGGSNVQVMKFDQDNKEGPGVLSVYRIDA